MVYYIRYLRTPQVGEASKKGLEITAVVAVTTDLGDSFLSDDVTLLVRVVDATKSGEILCVSEIAWKSGMRASKVNLQCSAKHSNRLVYLHITTRNTIASLTDCDVPAIVDVWSARLTMKPKSKAEALVERRLQLQGKSRVRIWEETGDSIARHIWFVVRCLNHLLLMEYRDASLGCLAYLNSCFDNAKGDSLPLLRKLLTDPESKRLRVLEVGAGCGIVGIALSQLRKCEVVLTDLEDAQTILKSNIDCAAPVSGSSLTRQVLGWGAGLHDLENARFDLVLVSDCIYNPDSSVLLVETLEQLSKHNPNVLIFVAYKPRHEADEVFFNHMRQRNMSVAEEGVIKLPHVMTDYDSSEPQVEAFVYRINH